MRFTGQTEFSCEIHALWQMITSPDQMGTCMPGLVTWQVIEEDKQFQVTITWRIVPKQEMQLMLFIDWIHLNPPHELVVEGKTAVNQLPINVQGNITLTPTAPHRTQLGFEADVTTPNRFLDQFVYTAVPPATAQFFKCLKASLPNS